MKTFNKPADSGRMVDMAEKMTREEVATTLEARDLYAEAEFVRHLAAQGQGEPVAWSRTGTIHDDDGRPIGEDEIEVHWGSEAPDDGWSPLYAAPAASPARMPEEPTREMLVAARDWSYKKYGTPIGNDAAQGCWKAMLAAAPSVQESQPNG